MKILITGSHGLVGTELISLLKSQGYQVVSLVRSNPKADEIIWQPLIGRIDKTQLEGFDAVIHLAGDNIASGRWTEAKKASLRDSRIKGTTLLSQTLASLKKPPKVLIAASAIGYYGDRGDEILNEKSSPGTGFLPELCCAWEASTQAASAAGIRVVNLRIGVVLSTKGGALAQILPPFKMGLGGQIGSGKQFFSWISLEDLIAIINYILLKKELSGPVNAVAPNPVTNLQFTKALGKALKRPTPFPMPDFAARLVFGEMADALLLASTRVQPEKLISDGYQFHYSKIDLALASQIR